MSFITEHIEPALNKRLPAALVAAFLFQTAGALFWAGTMAERVANVERETRVNSAAVEREIRLEAEVVAMHETLVRIEDKLDRISGKFPPPSVSAAERLRPTPPP